MKLCCKHTMFTTVETLDAFLLRSRKERALQVRLIHFVIETGLYPNMYPLFRASFYLPLVCLSSSLHFKMS